MPQMSSDVFLQMHHDPKPKDTDSEDDANVERKKPEGSWFPPQREKGLNTSDDNSDSASSDKGYWMSENESTVTTPAPNSSLLSVKTSIPTVKVSTTETSDKEVEKSTSKPSEWPSSSTATVSQRPSSHGSSTSTGLHLALSTTTTMSHPMTPTFGHAHHGGLFPHFPSFHPTRVHWDILMDRLVPNFFVTN
ncbi:hypothetical protein OS493_039614 [Desmophyllum pertusum]|uniref:Uncharacterized protein n=1 Tax=Desmophyllum pertusum TaxID=174260 RepID=A0A9W9YTU9_9CNID|nr:hypothetical protein OS493_039614 [Desmophyllum pertusum]